MLSSASEISVTAGGSVAGPQRLVMTAAELGLPGNKTYLALRARIRKQRLGGRETRRVLEEFILRIPRQRR